MGRLIKNTSFYTLGSILPKIGNFVFLPIYLKYLSVSDYGIISSLFVLNAIFVIVFSFALPRGIYRLYYDYKSKKLKNKFIGTLFLSVFSLSIFSLILIFIFRNYVEYIYKSIDFYPYFFYAILIAFFQALYEIPNILLQVIEKAKIYVLINVLLFSIKTILILLFIIKFNLGAVGYFQAELISIVLFLPIIYFTIRNEIRLKWDFNIFKNLISFCTPIVPGILAAWILNLSDRVFIERYYTMEEVGVYSLGYQIGGLVLIITSAFKQAYDPFFYKLANDSSDVKKNKNILFDTNFIFVIIIMFGGFIIALFSNEVIRIFFSEEYYKSILIIPIISLAYLMSQNSALLNLMIYQSKKTINIMYIAIFSALANIILNFTLIPIFGVLGAAWATLISFIMVFILTYNLAKKSYFIPYKWSKILLVFILLLSIYFIFNFLDISRLWISVILKILISIVIGYYIFYKHKDYFLKITKL